MAERIHMPTKGAIDEFIANEEDTEERAWIYCYKYLKCPISPFLLGLLKSMLTDTRKALPKPKDPPH